MLLALFVLLKGLAPVIAAQAVSGGFNRADVLTALHGTSGFGKALLAGFALVWVFAIVDCMRGRDVREPTEMTDR